MNPTLNHTQPPAPINTKGRKDDVKKIVILVVMLFVGFAIALGAYLVTQRQTLQNRATGQISCPVEGASCEWDPAELPSDLAVAEVSSYEDSQTYNYTILDKTTGKTVKTGTTKSTKVTFTPVLNHTYVCKVVTVSKCGVCDEQSVQQSCTSVITPTVTPSPTVTTTPSPSPSPTVTVTPSPTPTPNPECGSVCQTDSACPSQHVCRNNKCILDKCAPLSAVCTQDKCSVIPPTSTPTPTPTSTPTETPTPTPTSTPTNTPTPTLTKVPTSTVAVTAVPTEVVVAQSEPTEVPDVTTVPTIPSAGSSTGVYFMVIAGIVLASLLLVF